MKGMTKNSSKQIIATNLVGRYAGLLTSKGVLINFDLAIQKAKRRRFSIRHSSTAVTTKLT